MPVQGAGSRRHGFRSRSSGKRCQRRFVGASCRVARHVGDRSVGHVVLSALSHEADCEIQRGRVVDQLDDACAGADASQVTTASCERLERSGNSPTVEFETNPFVQGKCRNAIFCARRYSNCQAWRRRTGVWIRAMRSSSDSASQMSRRWITIRVGIAKSSAIASLML
jgi:hypothetical protein